MMPGKYPLPCGCGIIMVGEPDRPGIISRLEISHCPLHAAAGKMLAACKTALYYIDLTGDGVSSAEQNAKVALHAAIAAAEPEEHNG